MEKHIYIFKSETGECKIGVSNNVNKRRSTIEMQGGKRIVDVFYTTKCFNAYEIESALHRYYADKRLVGEWFDVNYNEAISILEKEFKTNAQFVCNNDGFDYISYYPVDDYMGLKVYFETNNVLNENENIVLAILRSLYSDKYNNNFMLSLDTIGYYVTNKFLNTKNQKERTIINRIKEAINSLYEKNIIDIVAQNNGNYVFNSKGLKLSEIDVDTLVELRNCDIHTIFSDGNKPFEIMQFYINLISIMKNNMCQITQDEIVAKWHYGKSTVNSYIKQLEDMNLLNVSKTHNKSNIYTNIEE